MNQLCVSNPVHRFFCFRADRLARGRVTFLVARRVARAALRLFLDGEIHNTKLRMPAILEKVDREAWLTGTPEEAWEALTPHPDDLMVAWPVSTRVNAPKNNDASLVEPIR